MHLVCYANQLLSFLIYSVIMLSSSNNFLHQAQKLLLRNELVLFIHYKLIITLSLFYIEIITSCTVITL